MLPNPQASPPSEQGSNGVIIVYTHDYRDLPDVLRVACALQQLLGLSPERAIAYKADAATLAGQYQRGIARRKQALGEAYVTARVASADPFTAEFQNMITRWAWQDIWTRPVFDDRTRRLIVLAITASLARWEEFRLHAKAGLDRELSPTELKELLQQAAIYAGVPVSVSGFKHASELLAERERARGA